MRRKINICLTFLLFSCTLAPEYERPTVVLPGEWRIPLEEIEAQVQWWDDFGDSVLASLIDQGLTSNQDLKTAIYRVEEFAARVEIAAADLYPQLNLSIDGSREKISTNRDPIQGGTASKFNSFDAILGASYLVDIWGKVQSQLKASKALYLSQVETRKFVVLSLISSIAKGYFRLRELDMQLAITKTTLDTRFESYKLAVTRYQLGLTSLIQVEQALSEVESSLAEEKRLENLIFIQEDLLSFLIGQPSESIPRGCTLSQMLLPPKVPEALPNDLLNQRPDIVSEEEKLKAANADIGVARARFFPELTLDGSFGSQSSKLSKFFKGSSLIWDYGGNIMQEIFTGGKLTGELHLTEATKKALIYSYLSTVLKAVQEVNDAYESHKIAKELVTIEKERTETFKAYYDLANLRYQEGETDYLTFLDAERRLFSAQITYIQALAESFTTYIDIYQSIGGPWVNLADEKASASTQQND
jgi:outer membrane protein, multidrug efflux system